MYIQIYSNPIQFGFVPPRLFTPDVHLTDTELSIHRTPGCPEFHRKFPTVFRVKSRTCFSGWNNNLETHISGNHISIYRLHNVFFFLFFFENSFAICKCIPWRINKGFRKAHWLLEILQMKATFRFLSPEKEGLLVNQSFINMVCIHSSTLWTSLFRMWRPQI